MNNTYTAFINLNVVDVLLYPVMLKDGHL